MANSELIMEPIFYFLAILPLVSFLYSSVGHGGASGYLALMALFSFPNETMKQTALILNLFVAGISFYQYYKAGHFKFKLFAWFAIGSIPTAYLGGIFDIDSNLYNKILGILLFFALFIWVNSSAALIGQFSIGIAFSSSLLPMIILALAGGLLGGYFGSKKWNNKKLEYFLVVVLAAASFKLLIL